MLFCFGFLSVTYIILMPGLRYTISKSWTNKKHTSIITSIFLVYLLILIFYVFNNAYVMKHDKRAATVIEMMMLIIDR